MTTFTPAPHVVGVVLAAGQGSRLRPLTQLLPKALCPVNQVPLLDRAVARLRPHVSRLAVNAHYLASTISDHVAGQQVTVSVETPEALGTAGALGKLRDWIAGSAVLVTNADAYLALHPDSAGHPDQELLTDFVTGWDGQRVRLLVQETCASSDFGTLRYAGTCLLPWSEVARLAPTPTGLYEVMWRQLWAEQALDLVPTEATFIDCGTARDYLEANLHASGGASVVPSDCRVHGSIDRCVLWPGSVVEPEESLTECIRAGDLTVPG